MEMNEADRAAAHREKLFPEEASERAIVAMDLSTISALLSGSLPEMERMGWATGYRMRLYVVAEALRGIEEDIAEWK